MTDPITLPREPDLPRAMDYAWLLGKGLRSLEAMSGGVWSDFNAHDPGITLLEQICFAISELGYRTGFPVADLLAEGGRDPGGAFDGPSTILTCRPVTRSDLRRLILDVDGVENAWVREDRPGPSLWYDRRRRQHGGTGFGSAAQAVDLRGMYRVGVQAASGVPQVVERVRRRLAENRGLCELCREVRVLPDQEFRLRLHVEVSAVDDPEAVLAAIEHRLFRAVTPTVEFQPVPGAGGAGEPRLEEALEGPRLESGWLPEAELLRLSRRTSVNASDLIREVLDVPGTRAVRAIELRSARLSSPWSLRVLEDHVPRLVIEPDDVVLFRSGRVVSIDSDRKETLRVAYGLEADATASSPPRTQGAPVGRNRRVARYRSILRQLPEIYGVGERGLPPSAAPERRARARQLKAYLLLMDQILASSHQQLAAVPDLLRAKEDRGTYEIRPVTDDALGLDEVRRSAPEDQLEELREVHGAAVDTGHAWDRRSRFLTHLLARYAEDLSDYALLSPGKEAGSAVRAKAAFLERYPELGAGRGCGPDLNAQVGQTCALQERVRLKLGLDEAEEFFLVEHILLRPDAADLPGARDDGEASSAWLEESAHADPFSLQLSFVVPDHGRFRAGTDSWKLIEEVVRAETPAHLTPHLLRMNRDVLGLFRADYLAWRGRFNGAHGADGIDELELRDNRNRVLEWLGLGHTAPLTEIPVEDSEITVPFGTRARVRLAWSQRGAVYQLLGPDGVLGAPAEGAGEPLELITDPIEEDVTLLVQVVRKGAGSRWDEPRRGIVEDQVVVRVGLDDSLPARVLGGDLAFEERAGDSDPRIVEDGSTVQVEIDRSQEGVAYTVVVVEEGGSTRRMSDEVMGRVDSIRLATQPLHGDVELRVQARKEFPEGFGKPAQQELLLARLPVLVRPPTQVSAEIEPGQGVPSEGTGALVLEESDPTCVYHLWTLGLEDLDFVQSEEETAGWLPVERGPEDAVQVRAPAIDIEAVPDGFTQVGEGLPGNGGELRIPTGFPQNALILVQISRLHGTSPPLTSIRNVGSLRVQLVHPNAQPPLRVRASVAVEGVTTRLFYEGGQPGVFYAFWGGEDDSPRWSPVYFHQRTETSNVGLGNLVVESDLVVAASGGQGEEPEAHAPTGPFVELEGDLAEDTLQVRALFAHSRMGAILEETLRVSPMPEILPATELVPYGERAHLVIRASVDGDRYEGFLGDSSAGRARRGNGEDLSLKLAKLEADAVFRIMVTRVEPGGVTFEREVFIPVAVAPTSDLEIEARPQEVVEGSSTTLAIQGPQTGIQYELRDPGGKVLSRVVGQEDRSDVELESGPLEATTTFTVVARRTSLPEAEVVLGAIEVGVRPPEPEAPEEPEEPEEPFSDEPDTPGPDAR